MPEVGSTICLPRVHPYISLKDLSIAYKAGGVKASPPQPSPGLPCLSLKLQEQLLVLHIRRYGHRLGVAVLDLGVPKQAFDPFPVEANNDLAIDDSGRT